MLSYWKLSNFKSVKQLASLRLAPLTLFTGTNSSGKSTVIQSMLLLKQSLSLAQEPGLMVLNGPYVTLGEQTLVSFRGNDNETVIGFQLEPAPVLDCEVSFQSRLPDPVTTSSRSPVQVNQTRVRVSEADRRPEASIVVGGQEPRIPQPYFDEYSEYWLREFLQCEVNLGKPHEAEIPHDRYRLKEKLVGCRLNSFLPRELAWAYNAEDAWASAKGSYLCELNEVGLPLRWGEESAKAHDNPWKKWGIDTDDLFIYEAREIPKPAVSLILDTVLAGCGLVGQFRSFLAKHGASHSSAEADQSSDAELAFLEEKLVRIWEPFINSLSQQQRNSLRKQLKNWKEKIIDAIRGSSQNVVPVGRSTQSHSRCS